MEPLDLIYRLVGVGALFALQVSPALGGARPAAFPRTPLPATGVLPSLRSGQVSLDEAEHFPAQSRSQRRYAPMVFGIIPECRSTSLRNKRSASPESAMDRRFECSPWTFANTGFSGKLAVVHSTTGRLMMRKSGSP